MSQSLPRKDLFSIPEGVIYLDGNSLGPLPKAVPARIAEVVNEQWGEQLIRAWNESGWMEQPGRVGDRIAALVGAPAGSVVMGDTLSIKVFQALAASVKMRPERRVILSDNGNFPSDLYVAEGLIDTIGKDYELRVVDPEAVEQAIDETVAVVMLTQVDYRSGRMHDMARITRLTHEAGAVSLWDLAHSAGAVPVELASSGCEFAVGCTYKYLNGGPGSPAFIYVRPDLIETAQPALSGWMGHDSPFAFEQGYRPATSIERMRVGTPPVIQMSALEAALDVWNDVDMNDLRATSVALSERFIAEVERRCPALVLASPRDATIRGSQVSFAFEHGYAAMQALIAKGVIGDFRAPNIMRFGFTPLYLDEADVVAAVDILQDILDNKRWADPAFQVAQSVT
ncbi:kynureninase [Granulosicoccus antarcticus]|uniref:Kynureninase n=1 Tax=Granulosicoccus antarcticus IMCC3135 TaxID=1192854 RepID=A0A2Z2P680_9GAMM|nr:kynureninase [Granulosicoccus antarcticus]ASJ75354.1 Kynureninase [Granulosicoccus antarcticus IMCC3135]